MHAEGMQESTFRFEGRDGLGIHTFRWLPGSEGEGEVEIKACLQIAHGMSEHALRYRGLAEALTGAGYAVYANDHRGHGRSVSKGQPLGHMGERDTWNAAVADVYALGLRILEEAPGKPLILLGHSMGSFLLQQLLFERPDHAIAAILSGSNGKPPPIAQVGRGIARAERLRLGKAGKSPLLQKMSFGEFNKSFEPARTEYDWLSRDPDVVDAYIADPLCGVPISTQSWVDLLDALAPLGQLENQRRIPAHTPLFLFSGERDPVGDFGRGVRRLRDAYRAAGLDDLTLRLYPEGRHEMLNEINREEVFADLLEFCDRVVREHS